MATSIPITVVTGFLGAGKTTLILSLLPQLPKDYKVVLLKNEYGDVEVDSKLAQQSSLTAVSEILNGCMCCILVGQMQNALLEIKENYNPDRIIIECSGSAFPATLAFQIRELERQTSGGLKLDAIVTVIDAENFTGYEDTSPTAKMQSSYTDIILINKWELVSERQLDTVLDHLHTLNDLTPKIRCHGQEGIDPKLIFGLETKLFLDSSAYKELEPSHNNEVETVTLYAGPVSERPHHHSHGDNACDCHDEATAQDSSAQVTRETLESALGIISKESVWRVKGLVRLQESGIHILNWAFGRYELTKFTSDTSLRCDVKMTIMGEHGEVKRASRKFAIAIGAEII